MKKAAIVEIKGGLGNQIFQYSFSKHLENMGFRVTYNLDFFKHSKKTSGDTKRDFHLDKLGCDVDEMSRLMKIFSNVLNYLINSKKVKKFFPFINKYIYKYLKEKDFNKNFDYKVYSMINYFDGYWQDFSFANIAKSRLTAICKSVVNTRIVQQRIATSVELVPDAICVHVRMGDYLSPSNQQIYRLPSTTYYELSVKKALSQGASSVIYLFSDEPAKARELLTDSLKDLVTINIVELEECSAFETIAWMSMFKYIVTANSTFSAWAAWFSQSENRSKYISSPSSWFKTKFSHLEPKLPLSWERIKASL